MAHRNRILGLIALFAAASCGQVESYDYADLLRGPAVVAEGGMYSEIVGPGSGEGGDAIMDAVARGEPLPKGARGTRYTMTLTGAVDRTTGKAELIVELEAPSEQLEAADLFIEGELVDSVSVERGGIVEENGHSSVATLVGWTPPPSRSWVPWGHTHELLTWRVEYGSEPDRKSSACQVRLDPFWVLRHGEARD